VGYAMSFASQGVQFQIFLYLNRADKFGARVEKQNRS
jgi:hypothetical protein